VAAERSRRARLRWPLPAVLGWALAWSVFFGLRALGVSPVWALPAATLAGVLAAFTGDTAWRRAFIAAGFPLSAGLLAMSTGGVPAMAWLAPLALLLLVYPINAWRDAPIFPTPEGALAGLAAALPLPAGARVLDAGCGLGQGLQALHAQYPQARLAGIEWSWPLALACRWRCPFAEVRRASLWSADWSGLDLVYLFQRPETMPRAAEKAAAEMRSGAWLVSLEFPVRAWEPHARLEAVPGKPVWVYRLSR
jgi:hypothetical protein